MFPMSSPELNTVQTQLLAKNIMVIVSKKILEWEELISITSLGASDFPVIINIALCPGKMRM